jgi:Pyruvate/2-oxoacid:ferredoxin oxidoreductase gamma subunit
MPYYYNIYVDNSTGDNVITVQYYDLENDTNSVIVNIYSGDTIVQTLTSLGEQNIVFTYNATALFNQTNSIYVELTANRNSPGFEAVKVLVYQYNKIRLAIVDYVGQNFINWVLIVLIGVLALTASIQTANYVALAIVGIGALFAIFGWLVISVSVLAIAGLVALVSLLKEGERNS